MMLWLSLLSILIVVVHSYRPIDGGGHNPAHPAWGMLNQPLYRKSPPVYADDVYATRKASNGSDLPSARKISDIVFQSLDPIPLSPRGHTEFLTYWGQFLDHDLTFTSGDPNGIRIPYISDPIVVPKNDVFFDPTGAGNVTIPFYRGVIAPGSGNSTMLPAIPLNLVTSWFDGSQVYGSNDTVARYLRTLTRGELKENPSHLGFPPFNDDPNSPIVMQTAGIANQSQLFIFGDARGNENPGLTVLHILFFREHNRRAREIYSINPLLSDEEIYQEARKMVIAIMHHITEEEYMPITLGEHLPEYTEFQPNTSPNVMVEFSTGAFRYGHSEVNSNFLLTGAGKPDGTVPLREAYFRPFFVLDNFDQLVAGMFSQRQGAVDTVFVDDLRNFLFGEPGKGGLDLTAINTQRGRDHGLPGINTFRLSFGLDIYEDFDDINSDPNVWQSLEKAYNSIDDCDVYVCGLAEPPFMVTSNIGQTFYTVIREQYLRTRDGDPAWYETPDYLSDSELKEARTTFLGDIIRRNTQFVDPKTVPCYVMSLPDGCGGVATSPPPINPRDYDFVVTMDINNNTGPVDALEDYFVLGINGVPQQTLTLVAGRTYTFFAQISCSDALIITDALDPEAPQSINGQYACLHKDPILTLVVDEKTPSTLYYDSALHPSMGGTINIVPAAPQVNGTVVGLAVALALVGFILVITLFYVFRKRKTGYQELLEKKPL